MLNNLNVKLTKCQYLRRTINTILYYILYTYFWPTFVLLAFHFSEILSNRIVIYDEQSESNDSYILYLYIPS
jgi:hypothetical protein